jgi:hypothetical protein
VVATSSQCHVYAAGNWSAPATFDLREPLRLLRLAERCMLTLDNGGGLQIWTYEGRPLCSPRFPGERAQVPACAVRPVHCPPAMVQSWAWPSRLPMQPLPLADGPLLPRAQACASSAWTSRP